MNINKQENVTIFEIRNIGRPIKRNTGFFIVTAISLQEGICFLFFLCEPLIVEICYLFVSYRAFNLLNRDNINKFGFQSFENHYLILSVSIILFI